MSIFAMRRLKQWLVGSYQTENTAFVPYDRTLLWFTFGLAVVGFVMVTSASMPVGQRLAEDPFLFAKRDGIYIVVAFFIALVTMRIPMAIWQRYSSLMLFGSILLLLMVLGSGVQLMVLHVGLLWGH